MADDQTFHEKVLTALARLDTIGAVQHTTVITRLDKINGHIDDLYARTEKAKIELMEHASKCVLRDRVGTIEVRLASGEFTSSKEAVDRIEALETALAEMLTASKWIKPGIITGVGLLGFLVLLHIHEVLTWLNLVKP